MDVTFLQRNFRCIYQSLSFMSIFIYKPPNSISWRDMCTVIQGDKILLVHFPFSIEVKMRIFPYILIFIFFCQMTSKKRSACSQRWSDLLMEFFSYQLPITQSKSNIVKISRYFAGRQTTSMKNFVKEHLGSQGDFICRLTYLIHTKVEIEPPSIHDKWVSP